MEPLNINVSKFGLIKRDTPRAINLDPLQTGGISNGGSQGSAHGMGGWVLRL